VLRNRPFDVKEDVIGSQTYVLFDERARGDVLEK
jgi:hypothetical protein